MKVLKKMILVFGSIAILAIYSNSALAGTDGEKKLKKTSQETTAGECFEKTSRAFFSFNQGLDKVLFKPVAKGYRVIPLPIRNGTSNVIGNLRSLLSLSNNLLQGDFRSAGNTAGRFVINSTVGILGIWDPAASFGFEKKSRDR